MISSRGHEELEETVSSSISPYWPSASLLCHSLDLLTQALPLLFTHVSRVPLDAHIHQTCARSSIQEDTQGVSREDTLDRIQFQSPQVLQPCHVMQHLVRHFASSDHDVHQTRILLDQNADVLSQVACPRTVRTVQTEELQAMKCKEE